MCTAAATSMFALAAPASAATSYRVTVTCSVPKSQPERQLAANWCLNYLPDGTQTFTAHVRNSSGSPVSGVRVTWTDSDPSRGTHFRTRQNPCVTGSNGSCSAEFVDRSPTSGQRTTMTATAGTNTGTGYLSFARR